MKDSEATSLLLTRSVSEVIQWQYEWNTEVVLVLSRIDQSSITQWLTINWKWLKLYLLVIPDRVCGGYFLSGPSWWSDKYYYPIEDMGELWKII